MAEKRPKSLRELEKEAGPIIPKPYTPENKFLSKAEFVKKQETAKLRKKAGAEAMRKFDEDQDKLDKKKADAGEKATAKAEKDADKIVFAVKKGNKVIKTFADRDKAIAFVEDHKDSDKLKVTEQ